MTTLNTSWTHKYLINLALTNIEAGILFDLISGYLMKLGSPPSEYYKDIAETLGVTVREIEEMHEKKVELLCKIQENIATVNANMREQLGDDSLTNKLDAEEIKHKQEVEKELADKLVDKTEESKDD